MMQLTQEPDLEEASHESRIFRDKNKVRYLKLIAVFKMGKGLFLLCLGVSLIFLNKRTHWLDSISDWATDELLVVHSRMLHYLLDQLQKALINGHLRATGVLSLFYSAVLFTESIGVYLQKRWGELLMVFATSALIPLEIHHLFVKPGLVAAIILVVNCFIVWFLYRVLRRERTHRHAATPHEMANVG
jgi:uncharacterized membrane protein (DUF2068 family)